MEQTELLQQGQKIDGGTVAFDQMTGRKLEKGEFSTPVNSKFDINTGRQIPTSVLGSNVQELKFPNVPPDTSAPALNGYVSGLVPQFTTPTTLVKPSREKITELTRKIGQETQLLNKAYEEEGVFTEKAEVENLRDELLAEQNATNNRIERLREKGGMTQEAIAGEISRIERDSASKRADIAIALSLAERRFDRVKNLAERKVEIELAPLRTELEIEKAFYEENKDYFTTQEQRAFEANLLQDTRNYENKKAERLEISNLAQEIAKNGAPSNIVQAVLNSPSREAAILAGSSYFAKPATTTGVTGVSAGLMGNPFYDALANASIGLPENQRNENIARLNSLINAGEEDKARDLIKRTAFQSLTGTDRSATIERSQAIDALTSIKQALNDYVQKTGDTNVLKGSIQDIQTRLGTAGDPELVKIGARITQALQVYRSAITGAAWGEQEDEEYKQLFPSFKNTNKLNGAIIDGMLSALDANNRVYLETVLGGKDTYDAVFKTGEQAPQTPVFSNNVDLTSFETTPQSTYSIFPADYKAELENYNIPNLSSFFK